MITAIMTPRPMAARAERRASPVASEVTKREPDGNRGVAGKAPEPDEEERRQQDDRGNEGDDPEDELGGARRCRVPAPVLARVAEEQECDDEKDDPGQRRSVDLFAAGRDGPTGRPRRKVV